MAEKNEKAPSPVGGGKLKAKTVPGMIKEINRRLEKLKPGERLRFPSLPDEVYFAADGVGSTAMREAHKSMAHYKAYITKSKEVSAQQQTIFDFGSAAHCAVLEPDEFDERYVSMPEGMAKRGKEYTEFKEENEGKTILSHDAMQHVLCIRTVVLSGHTTSKLVQGGQSEVAYFYKHKSGLILKAKVDHEPEPFIGTDLKTSKDADPEKAKKTVKYDYSIQCALYRMVADLEDFVFVVVEKVPPYAKCIVRNDADVRRRAERRLEEVINQICFAQTVDEWPGYDEDVVHESELTNYEKSQEQLNE